MPISILSNLISADHNEPQWLYQNAPIEGWFKRSPYNDPFGLAPRIEVRVFDQWERAGMVEYHPDFRSVPYLRITQAGRDFVAFQALPEEERNAIYRARNEAFISGLA